MTRGWLLILAVGLVVLAAGNAILTPAPADAEIPPGLRAAVDDARASLLDHGDLIDPGSPLVLTGAHCREDGGVLFTFSNRWLWIIERSYHASTDGPPAGSSSFGGGVLDRPVRSEIDAWLADMREVDCSDVATPWCEGDGYGIAYPIGWFVHPADPVQRIAACALFGAMPFEPVRGPNGHWAGPDVQIRLGQGCRVTFDVVVASAHVEVDGLPAVAAQVTDGHGVPGSDAYEYLVSLSAPIPCEQSAWLVARTEAAAPIGFEAASAILDEMMGTLRVEGDR